MTVRNTASAEIRRALDALGTYAVTITPSRAESVDKLGWLAADDRNFLAVTPAMTDAAHHAFAEALPAFLAGGPTDGLRAALGEAVLQHVVLRFRGGPRDVRMRPLARATVQRKGHARVGVDTGALAQSLVDARVAVRKVG